ncbi:MAG TPA: hypothetical protein VMZ27_01225 [Candidatus Saccharimonadales bacterium]|nr:hypothetical protein [Candidatus Saccharimonadales bacterium]
MILFTGNLKTAFAAQAGLGEFGGDLGLLSRFCAGPRAEGESNYFFDLWADQNMASILRRHGFTNNHALFINSHGKGDERTPKASFIFYPHPSICKVEGEAAWYSARDFATVLGRTTAASINNIYVAACDEEGCFSASELRSHFPNATNIVHAAKGEPGYQPMFYDSIVNHSSQIESLYETRVEDSNGQFAFELGPEPKGGARKLLPYIADLFTRGATNAYRRQIAGRELLTCSGVSSSATRASLVEQSVLQPAKPGQQ